MYEDELYDWKFSKLVDEFFYLSERLEESITIEHWRDAFDEMCMMRDLSEHMVHRIHRKIDYDV